MLRRSWLKGIAAAFAGIAAETVGRSSYAGGTVANSYKGGSPPETVADTVDPMLELPVEPEVGHHAPSPTMTNIELGEKILNPPGGIAASPTGTAKADYEAMRGDCPPRHYHHSSHRWMMEQHTVLPGGALSMGVGNRRDPDNIRRMQEAQERYLAKLEGFVPPPDRYSLHV